MKINRLLTAALITMATVLTGCVKESVWDRNTGIDETKAAPEDFTYDEEASSKNTLAVSSNEFLVLTLPSPKSTNVSLFNPSNKLSVPVP